MADLLSVDSLVLFLIFVVPGFVAIRAHDLMVPAARRNFSDSIIEVISYSMINLAVLFWAVSLLHEEGFQQQHPVYYYLGMFGVLFLSPIALAVAARLARHPRVLGRFLLQPAPTAWDSFFDKRQHMWVLCHLKDGRLVGGIYANNSCTSSYPFPQDIYIEEMWKLNDEGEFVEQVTQTQGILVRADECHFIEFFKPEE